MKHQLLNIVLVLGILLFSIRSQAQDPTVGLLHSNSDAFDGYTLFTPQQNQNVYLINNCGEKINEWTFSELPGATCYLLENGTLLRAGKDSLEIRDWDNTLLWSYPTTANGILQHHDIEPLPNGNILCVGKESFTADEMIALGRDPSLLETEFKIDVIQEIEPIGLNGGNIVWEWKFSDHFIQDFDDTKPNFGIVEDHPELLDLNFDNTYFTDFTHVNSIDYNAGLDQIIISARNLNEIYIIDHSTTTEEAAGHIGGNSNNGGDFLWRWGNMMAYRQGTIDNQKLFLQHDAKWVEDEYLDGGKISVFNNLGSLDGDFSSIHLINPQMDGYNYLMENNTYLPNEYEWTWSGAILGDTVFENKKSGTHSLPNGNFIICETGLGQVSEITKSGEHLWTYKNPSGEIIFNQFEGPFLNQMFRAEKYPADYIGFDGRDMTPDGIIEDQNSNSVACLGVGIENSVNAGLIKIVNPASNGFIIFNRSIHANAVIISDISGKTVLSHGAFKGSQLEINLKPGVYLMQVFINKKIETLKVIVQ